MNYFAHDPDAGPLHYNIEFTSWLKIGDAISTIVWSSSPSGLTLSNQSLTAAVATIEVTGGVLGSLYDACHNSTGQIMVKSR
jgi:hypothetical protein